MKEVNLILEEREPKIPDIYLSDLGPQHLIIYEFGGGNNLRSCRWHEKDKKWVSLDSRGVVVDRCDFLSQILQGDIVISRKVIKVFDLSNSGK